MTREEVFDEMYQAIAAKLAVPQDNPYGASIISFTPPYEEAKFPIIVFSQTDYNLESETLGKAEKRYRMVVEANVYAIKTPTASKRTIANSVAEIVSTTLDLDFGMKLISSNAVPNLKENVHRVVMIFSGIVDEDTKIIYRN